MTEISGTIAKKWKQETDEVKAEYTKLAAQVDELNKKHFSKFSRKKNHKKDQIKSSSILSPIILSVMNDVYG